MRKKPDTRPAAVHEWMTVDYRADLHGEAVVRYIRRLERERDSWQDAHDDARRTAAREREWREGVIADAVFADPAVRRRLSAHDARGLVRSIVAALVGDARGDQ